MFEITQKVSVEDAKAFIKAKVNSLSKEQTGEIFRKITEEYGLSYTPVTVVSQSRSKTSYRIKRGPGTHGDLMKWIKNKINTGTSGDRLYVKEAEKRAVSFGFQPNSAKQNYKRLEQEGLVRKVRDGIYEIV